MERYVYIMIEITRQVKKIEVDDVALIRCGENSIGFNNSWVIDWERFWENFEGEGFDMQDLGGPVYNHIQRRVRKLVKEEEIQ